MVSTFTSYHISGSGRSAYQKAIDVTGHNVVNLNTDGYVRQQAINQETSPLKYGFFKIGSGVSVEQVRQIRSLFLDAQYRNSNSTLGYRTAVQDAISGIEGVFDDLSDLGISDSISEFFESWVDLSKDPTNLTARASVLEYAENLLNALSSLSEQLDDIQKNLDDQIVSTVDDINDIADEIAVLNDKIAQSELRGENANDYRDQRNALLDALSELVNISVVENDDGSVNVTIGGNYLVSGNNVNKLKCVENDENGEFNTVKWENTDKKVKLTDGKLLGLIECRGDVAGYAGSVENGSVEESDDVDADASAYDFSPETDYIIPEIRKAINMMVSLLVRKVNSIHSSGVGLDGSTGIDFFARIDDSLPFEMGNIQVNPELEEDTNLIAASADGSTGDGSNASAIAEFADEEYFQSDGSAMSIVDYYNSIVDWLSTTGEKAESYTDNQETLLAQIEENRQQLSSVSSDEEMSNLIKFQQSYNACVRNFSVVDEMINRLINGTGIVGRS